MDYVKLGRSGLDVSRICLGTMGFGVPQPNFHQWVLNYDDSRTIIRRAYEAGVNFFDTANTYSAGTSEEFVGRALNELNDRDRLVVATKVYFRMHDGPNGMGLSRKAIHSEVDKSLKRLGMDYIDLLQIHRWDYATPIEETMAALHDLVKAGKVLYLGASAMKAYQLLRAQLTADHCGFTRFVSMQNHLNLIYREEEREMLPLCREEGVAVIPYSPLAGGRLTRDWSESTAREASDRVLHAKYDKSMENDRPIVDRLAGIATARGVPRAQAGLAWLLQKEGVTAPIVGATKIGHLDDAVAALSVKLTPEEIASLEEPYVPHAVQGAL
ncbi:aldo/keto reductase [Sorangium sp. So ce448]|uniref:aldo/keto reductase n=1 Tax=Sorangium sp. So ce448 TaxID=3133314 RepID=UPI003F636561